MHSSGRPTPCWHPPPPHPSAFYCRTVSVFQATGQLRCIYKLPSVNAWRSTKAAKFLISSIIAGWRPVLVAHSRPLPFPWFGVGRKLVCSLSGYASCNVRCNERTRSFPEPQTFGNFEKEVWTTRPPRAITRAVAASPHCRDVLAVRTLSTIRRTPFLTFGWRGRRNPP